MTATTEPKGFISRAPRLGFIPGFDGIRGLWVLFVIYAHIMPGDFESFAPVVDVFFVMSAFLIVTLLMQEYRDHGRISMRKFYARRAVRLLPSVYVYMAVWIVVGVIAQLAGARFEGRNLLVEVLKDCGAAVTYVYHLIFPLGLAAVAPDEKLRPLGQFWSLSVEEQFYLVIAITMVVCLRRNKARALAVGGIALAIWIQISRWRFDLGPWPGDRLDAGVWTRGLQLLWMQRPDALFMGVALAVVNARLPNPLPDRWRKPLLTLGWLCFAMLWVCLLSSSELLRDKFGLPFVYNAPERVRNVGDTVWCAVKAPGTGVADALTKFHPCTDRMWFMRWGHTVVAWCIGPVVLCLARYKDWILNRLLGVKPLHFLGRMSYTLYVWHVLPIVILDGAMAGSGRVARTIVMFGATFACSLPVYYLVEQRALKMKLRFATEKQTLDLSTGKMIDVEAAQRTAAERSHTNDE